MSLAARSMCESILILLLAVGTCGAELWHSLTCPYGLNQESLQRVWCRQSSVDCCYGFTFDKSARVLKEGRLQVTQGSDSFTVAVLEPDYREGVYWCGLLSRNNTFIRLAERHFGRTADSISDIWGICRWILLLLLPTVTIFANIYTRASSKRMLERPEPIYGDIDVQQTSFLELKG